MEIIAKYSGIVDLSTRYYCCMIKICIDAEGKIIFVLNIIFLITNFVRKTDIKKRGQI